MYIYVHTCTYTYVCQYVHIHIRHYIYVPVARLVILQPDIVLSPKYALSSTCFHRCVIKSVIESYQASLTAHQFLSRQF